MTQPPILTIGKNLGGISVLKDKTNLITKLYPRGAGQFPSELALDTPEYWPAAQRLVVNSTDSAGNAYFRLPSPHSTYAGFTKSGDPLPSDYYVGWDTFYFVNLPAKGDTTLAPEPDGGNANTIGFIMASTNAMGMVFHVPGGFRPDSIALQLQRLGEGTRTNWETQPRFIVGLYSTTPSVTVQIGSSTPSQLPNFMVPYQGPLCWCYGSLLSIDTELPHWYTFPVQSNQYPAGWYAVVVMPYPTSNTQWSINDYLAFGAAPGTGSNTYATWCISGGVSPKNWLCPTPGESSPWSYQMACKLAIISTDYTSRFVQADLGEPGRYLFCRAGDAPSGGWWQHQFIFHYKHSPYLINWETYKKYGKYEGVFKDDSITTQAGLIAAGSNYLASVSEPSMTISLGAVDLYNIDPEKNWAEELTVGGEVRVIDDVMGLDEMCIITRINKADLTQPHTIDTLTLNNINPNAQKLIAQIATRNKKMYNYMQGQTVEAPQGAASAGDAETPVYMALMIRDVTDLTHAVKMSVRSPGDVAFKIEIDGNAVI